MKRQNMDIAGVVLNDPIPKDSIEVIDVTVIALQYVTSLNFMTDFWFRYRTGIIELSRYQ